MKGKIFWERGEDMEKKKKVSGSCDTCEFYDYDEYTDSYFCRVNLDEDDMSRYMSRSFQCPYYRNGDEYRVVRKQI